MAKILSKSGVTSLSVVKPGQISQSIDAFTGAHAYDIYLSGSFNMTGSITGSSTVSMLTASIGGGAFTSASLTANSGVGTLQQVTDQGSITTTPITASFISSSNDITCLRVFATNINGPEFASSTGLITVQTPTKFALGAAITSSAPISSSGYLIINDITASGNISSSGNLTALDLNLFGGDIDLKNTGAQSNIKFYCESSNAHYTKLQAAPHAAYSGNPTATLPAYDLDFAAPNFQAAVTASTFSGSGAALTNLQRPITSSTTHFTASNNNTGFYFRANGGVTCSIQPNSVVTCDIGNEFEIFQTSSAGYVLFATGSGVTLNSKSGNQKLTGQFSAATLKKIGTDEWDLIGDLG